MAECEAPRSVATVLRRRWLRTQSRDRAQGPGLQVARVTQQREPCLSLFYPCRNRRYRVGCWRVGLPEDTASLSLPPQGWGHRRPPARRGPLFTQATTGSRGPANEGPASLLGCCEWCAPSRAAFPSLFFSCGTEMHPRAFALRSLCILLICLLNFEAGSCKLLNCRAGLHLVTLLL